MTPDLLLQRLAVCEGTVAALADDGRVLVETADGPLPCRLLQTAQAPPPALAPGDEVLVVAPPGAGGGFVLGRIALHAPAPAPAPATVEVVAPAGAESVRLSARRIHLIASDEVVIECGGGRLRIDGRGKVVVLGTDVTTRARRLHKIKGGTVAIN